jgi:hypothetical protein
MERNHDNSRVPPDAIGEVDGGYVTTIERITDATRYSGAPLGVTVTGRVSDAARFLVWVPVDPPKPAMVEIEADRLERLVWRAGFYPVPVAIKEDQQVAMRLIADARAGAAGR